MRTKAWEPPDSLTMFIDNAVLATLAKEAKEKHLLTEEWLANQVEKEKQMKEAFGTFTMTDGTQYRIMGDTIQIAVTTWEDIEQVPSRHLIQITEQLRK